MVGKLEHKMTSTDEDRYRCFVWSSSSDNRIYDVAQSGDATCNGLPSATEGSRTMRLTQGKYQFQPFFNFRKIHIEKMNIWETCTRKIPLEKSSFGFSVRTKKNYYLLRSALLSRVRTCMPQPNIAGCRGVRQHSDNGGTPTNAQRTLFVGVLPLSERLGTPLCLAEAF